MLNLSQIQIIKLDMRMPTISRFLISWLVCSSPGSWSAIHDLLVSVHHTKNLPLWTKPLTLANHWAALSLFIFSSSALTQSLLVSGLAASAPTWAIVFCFFFPIKHLLSFKPAQLMIQCRRLQHTPSTVLDSLQSSSIILSNSQISYFLGNDQPCSTVWQNPVS